MSAPIPRENRLKRFLNDPNGVTAAQAERRAARNMAVLRPACEASVANALAALGEYLRLLNGAPNEILRDELHRLACGVIELGGVLGRNALSGAAYSFCRLLDELGAAWDREAAEVHLEAMKLLFGSDRAGDGDEASVLAGLDKVRLKAVGAAEG